MPRDAYSRPLIAVRLEHDRQLKISEWLLKHGEDERLEAIEGSVDELLQYLTRDLVLHHRDEEEDLFPTLRKRCDPNDRIESILAELAHDHATEGFLMRDIVVDLHRLVERRAIESPGRFFMSLRLFAEGQQRHLVWENEVVIPLARRRLLAIDLEAFARSMTARRSPP